MTKPITLIAVMSLAVIAIILLAGLYIQARAENLRVQQNNINETLAITSARKEDLQARQLQLQAMIADLNQSLQNQMAGEENLSKKLTNLTGKINAVTIPKPVVLPPVQPPPVQPPPVQRPPRVTSAS
jgi:uncharacterized protein YlxW (UPF0749 family)